MARLRRKQRQHDAARAAAPARRQPIQRREAHPLDAQQHALGNQAVQRLIDSRAVQPKLVVGAPNDAYEQEADRVADQVMGTTPAHETTTGGRGAQNIHRMEEAVHRAGKDDDKKKEPAKDGGKKEGAKKEGDKKEAGKDNKKKEDDKAKRKPIMDDEKDEKKEEEPVQREAAAETAVPEVSPALEASLDAQQGGGGPLPEPLQEFFEPRLGADLSDVRIHADQQAAQAAADLEAQAFTRGQDVYFGEGYFDPQSTRGRWLLAHELTHTVQHGEKSGAPERDRQSGGFDAPFTIEVRPGAPLLVARKEDDDEQ
jgi:hypothetical protein